MNKRDILESIIAVGVIVGMILGSITYFATAKDLKLVEMRLDQKVVSDAVMQMSERLWQLEDRHKGEGDCINWTDDSDREEYRSLKLKLENLKKRQDALMEKGQ